jgi:hypothetical protein
MLTRTEEVRNQKKGKMRLLKPSFTLSRAYKNSNKTKDRRYKKTKGKNQDMKSKTHILNLQFKPTQALAHASALPRDATPATTYTRSRG